MFYSFFVLLSYCRSGLKTDYKSRLYRARKGRGHGIIIKKKALVFLMFKCAQAIVFPTANTTITVTFPRETREGWTLLTIERGGAWSSRGGAWSSRGGAWSSRGGAWSSRGEAWSSGQSAWLL
jgi:hypothetical protein